MKLKPEVIMYTPEKYEKVMAHLTYLRENRFWPNKYPIRRISKFPEYIALESLKKRGYDVSWSPCLNFYDGKSYNKRVRRNFLRTIATKFIFTHCLLEEIEEETNRVGNYIGNKNVVRLLGFLQQYYKGKRGANTKGIPDIFAFKKNDFFFAEVKGWNDKLSKDQLKFILACTEAGISNVKLIHILPKQIEMGKVKQLVTVTHQ